MKSKKLFLPAVIIAVAILAIAIFCTVFSIAKKPTVTEGEFPFSITYELNGETVTIDEVYTAYYVGNGGYTDTKSRIYYGKIGNMDENDAFITLKEDENESIFLYTKLYADYLMGDAEDRYFDDGEFAPEIFYYDSEGTEYADEETLLAHGVKLISWEYPTPIENSLVFSHLSYLNGNVVLPALIISVLALLAIIIFVKKEKDFACETVDIVSTVFNFIISFTVVPYYAICGWLLDITGDNGHIIIQAFYFSSALTVFGIAASVALRRKGYKKSSLWIQFIIPAFFALLVFLSSIGIF